MAAILDSVIPEGYNLGEITDYNYTDDMLQQL